MLRVQVFVKGKWCWGLKDYTPAQAEKRLEELKSLGIKARVRPASELLD